MSSSTLNSEITSSIIQCVFNPRIEGSSTTNLSREPRFYQRPNFSAVGQIISLVNEYNVILTSTTGDQETMGHRPSSVVPQAPSYKQCKLHSLLIYIYWHNITAAYLRDKPRCKSSVVILQFASTYTSFTQTDGIETTMQMITIFLVTALRWRICHFAIEAVIPATSLKIEDQTF